MTNVTKENTRILYNLYAQKEASESIVKQLEEFVKTQDSRVPDIIDRNYADCGSIQIHIPYFDGGKFDENRGRRVFNISYKAALRVLKNHIRSLNRQIEEASNKLLEDLRNEK